MQHNYISQGKNYISSKRASEISDYASDYIGQLCRAGKLDCTRVGHVWFVTEESLRAHMTRVWSDDALRVRANNLQKRFIKNASGSSTVVPNAQSTKKQITSKQAALLSGYAADYIGQLCRSGKIDGVLVGKTWMVDEESLKAYIEKLKIEKIRIEEERRKEVEARNFAEASRKSMNVVLNNPSDVVQKRLSERAKASENELLRQQAETAYVSGRHAKGWQRTPSIQILMKRSVLTLATLAVLVIVGSVTLVKFVGIQNSAVRQPLVASVYNTATSINNLVTGGRGLAVAPISGSVSSDAEMRAAINDSFSDQVNVQPDESGTAGVITPVFKKTNGKDFMYVMVPVKDKNNVQGSTSNVQ